MGVVYQAHDTRLRRRVALKFLPPEFAQNRRRLARFEREAKILAGLNHPNIATLHNFEQHRGVRFFVLELVPGQTLAEIFSRRRMPVDELAAVFCQIALALESAHDAGVIHRDLKPANVKVTADGTVKVLDFGLASSPAGYRDVDQADMSTVLHESTESSLRVAEPGHDGTWAVSRTTGIQGTVPYMSPEQVQGKPVDKRTDIWAFGCCLYEALARQRAFRGNTVADVLEVESLTSTTSKTEVGWSVYSSRVPTTTETCGSGSDISLQASW